MDTEAQIAADLATQIPKDDIATPPAEPEVTEDEQFVDKILPESPIEKLKLYDYFELSLQDRRSPEAEKYLTAVIEWARSEAGSSDYADILRVIHEQERILGSRLKPQRLSTMYRFATIRAARNRLIEEERALYG